jgi:glycosyltransferase involved in cell wall biosynthesis
MTSVRSIPLSFERRWRRLAHEWGSIVCISTADYNAQLWTNKQHLMSRLATELPVVYVESLGLRRPRLTQRDFHRALRRLRSTSVNSSSRTDQHLRVVSPLVLPWHGSGPVRRVNYFLLKAQLRSLVEVLPSPKLLWAYAPIVTDELDLSTFDAVVYHCVDDLATVPGIPAKAIRDLERKVAAVADIVFASAPTLVDRLSPASRRTYLVPNVADVAHFVAARSAQREPADMAPIPRPRVLFVGALSDYKIDWTLVREVVALLPDFSFVFIGPAGDETATRKGLRPDASNCHFLGHRSYVDLPAYMASADVGTIPYQLTTHTAGVYPLKVIEYVAAGLPVVAVPLPALGCRPELPISFATTPTDFAFAIRDAIRRARGRRPSVDLARYSWDSMLAEMFSRLRVVSHGLAA